MADALQQSTESETSVREKDDYLTDFWDCEHGSMRRNDRTDDASRFLIFESVQDYVFSDEDKQAFLELSEADQVHWLRGVDRSATKVWKYEVHAGARGFFQNCVFGPTRRGPVEEYQCNLGLDGSTKCVLDM